MTADEPVEGRPFRVIASHRDDVEWCRVEKLPPSLHKCFVQSDYIRQFDSIQRCACGAISSNNDRHWVFKNESRKSRKRNAR